MTQAASGPAQGGARVALIHALEHSMAPVEEEFRQQWPQAIRANLLDGSLSFDLAAGGARVASEMRLRIARLTDYALDCGAQGILFTCSAFGDAIEQVVLAHPTVPIVKPNEAMILEAEGYGRPIGLIATFAPTLKSMAAEFAPGTQLEGGLAEGALEALDRGDTELHDRLIAEQAAVMHKRGCEVIALAQFSMARAAAAVARRCGDAPVLTTPRSAVREIHRRISLAPPAQAAKLRPLSPRLPV
jgi:hypothetical protein